MLLNCNCSTPSTGSHFTPVPSPLARTPFIAAAGFEQLAAAEKRKEEEQRSGKRRKGESDDDEEEEGMDPEMAAMMGFGGFGSSKQ
jgi:hypothetical protein